MIQRIPTPFGKTRAYSENASPADSYAERVVVVPGYSEGITHNKSLVRALAQKGFNAITFGQPRRADKNIERVRDPIERQGDVLLSLIEATVTDGEKVHVVAHSLGSAAILRAAQTAPEHFSSITLMQPLGMGGQQTLTEMASHVNRKTLRNHRLALRAQVPSTETPQGYAARPDKESALKHFVRVAKAQVAGGNVLLTQPVLAVKEALASGKYEIADDIAAVTELGIPVNIVVAHSDEMFDADLVAKGYEKSIHTASSFSSVADPEAGHDTAWMQPERTAQIVESLIRK